MDSQSPNQPSGGIPVMQLSESDTQDAGHVSPSHVGRIWIMALVIPLLLGGVVGVVSKYGTEISQPKAQVVVPLGVIATCRIVSNNPRVELSWTPPSATTEEVLTKKNLQGVFTDIAKGTGLRSYADADVRFGEQYTYEVSLGKTGVSEDATLLVTPKDCKTSSTPSPSPSPQPTPKKQ